MRTANQRGGSWMEREKGWVRLGLGERWRGRRGRKGDERSDGAMEKKERKGGQDEGASDRNEEGRMEGTNVGDSTHDQEGN